MIQTLRRLLLAGLFIAPLAGCGGGGDIAAVSYAPPDYDYLNKLRLNVASVDIDDSQPAPGDLGRLASTPPVDALRRMAQDRLIAQGSSGRAVFVIDEASVGAAGGQYQGRMAVHLDVTNADGSGTAAARVTRSRSQASLGPNAERAALSELVAQMMTEMNVELEFQVRRSLKAALSTAPTTAAAPTPIQSEELSPPS